MNDRDFLKWAALAATFVVTASGEYELARVCGFGYWVAAGVPAALDIYALRAMRAHRDVLAVVVSMIAVNAASHAVSAGLMPVSVWLVVAVSAIAPLVLWRVHSLGTTPEPEANLLDVIQEVPPVPVSVERVAEPQVTGVTLPADLREASTLGPMFPLAELLAGTGRDQGERLAGVTPSLAGVTPAERAEPAEPAPGTGGTGSSSGEVPPGVAAEHVTAVRQWLAADPELTGTAIGTRLGKSDGYGRRVKRAALAVTA
ncbi:hypothetical protein QMK19_30520 [Streptomyces sp. H10-C2]|uniref:hypothetical protein n=1 Tax=unclassified Streptomyces TaxID=2593676 RepID=UPI0024B8CA85|nr:MULTISPECIES: hypothetical protein [unclassified Streptomyces]MDJ0345965.1 hypothetical protein [Streptomyces sp. PH10-H1]MDJ0373868.1 hypothetical protein [Streptomyces sp. H10-C2]